MNFKRELTAKILHNIKEDKLLLTVNKYSIRVNPFYDWATVLKSTFAGLQSQNYKNVHSLRLQVVCNSMITLSVCKPL